MPSIEAHQNRPFTVGYFFMRENALVQVYMVIHLKTTLKGDLLRYDVIFGY